jgi:hypothetical protein
MATTLIRQVRDESIDVGRLSTRSGDLYVCAECKYAQPFAVQPRAVCTCEGSASVGTVLFAGQPVCADMSPRGGEELVLSMCTPGVKATHARFVGAGSRAH